MLANGKETCTCTRTSCERHGDCEACLSHHAAHKKYPPSCIRKQEREARSKAVRAAKRKDAGKAQTSG